MAGENGRSIPFPPQDAAFEQKCSLAIAGAKMRYETYGPQIISQTRSFEPRWYLSITNGRDSKSFYSKDESLRNRFPPCGFVQSSNDCIDAEGIDLRPLLLIYKPSHPAIANTFDIAKFSKPIEMQDAHGRDCVRIERASWFEKMSLVLEVQADYRPLEARSYVRDQESGAWRLGHALKIDYEENSTVSMFRPNGWTYSMFGASGELSLEGKAVVTSCETNSRLPDSLFEFAFPVGTLVNDSKGGEYYILREDGVKRHITESEQVWGVTYKDLFATESGSALAHSARRLESRDSTMWVIVCFVLGIVVVVFYALRMRR